MCTLAYGVSFALGNVATVTLIPIAFGETYQFGPVSDGLVYISILVGVLIGEQAAGPVSDMIMRKQATHRKERRLKAAVPGAILVPIGLVRSSQFCAGLFRVSRVMSRLTRA